MFLKKHFIPVTKFIDFQYYVYSLIDTRNNSVFYIGKGQGKRMFQHKAEYLKGVCSKKCLRIKDIVISGRDVLPVKIMGFNDEQAAYDYETDIIEYYGLKYLTNVLPGGQKAWDKRRQQRALARKEKQRSKEPLWSVVIERMWIIRDWAVKTGNGLFKVEPVFEYGSKTQNFQNAVSSMAASVYNDVIPVILKNAINDKDNGHKVIDKLKEYGIHSICGVPINGSA